VPQEVWIIDTSAVAQIRRVVPLPQRKEVFARLSKQIEDGCLAFPRQIFDEMERGKLKNDHDHAWTWVKQSMSHCAQHEPLHDFVREAFNVPQVMRVLDPDKDHEEADPYVLALSLKLRATGHPVGVITEDRRTRPTKLSLSDACGLLRIVSISVEPYLEQQDIWSVRG